jgi:hypothetical protein
MIKKVSSDGIGVGVTVDVGRQIAKILQDRGVELGMILDGGGDGEPVIVVMSRSNLGRGTTCASVASNPEVWAVTRDADEDA